MTEIESLMQYGLKPTSADLPAIRELLASQVQKEKEAQGRGDAELMKLCCIQLFNAGLLRDVLAIWSAKTASMDSDGSIEIQLLCGGGIEVTKGFLSTQDSDEAQAALTRILECEAAGDFGAFSVDDFSTFYENYYSDDAS